jgi:hypothetical protein
MIFWFEDDGTMKQRRSEPQMGSTRILGIACDPENKVVSAGTRESGADDARVFTVLGLFDPKITYDDGVAGDDAAGAVACDPRGFCGWGGYRTTNGIRVRRRTGCTTPEHRCSRSPRCGSARRHEVIA